MKFPVFPLVDSLPWLKDVSVWSAPPTKRVADIRDSFLLGGDGHLSGRIGTRDRVSTMERIMAPYLSSYNFAENANFRMDAVTPSRDFYPPFVFTPTEQHVWRVKNTAIYITCERDAEYQLVTVSAVHPRLHAYLRHATLTNISRKRINDIGLSFEATPDIPYPIAGHRSVILPFGESELVERVEEMKPTERDYGSSYSNETQRYRYMLRGTVGATIRGYQDLFVHIDALEAKASLMAVHYLVPSLDDTEEGAIQSAKRFNRELEEKGVELLFKEIHEHWLNERVERTRFESSEIAYSELLENNAVMQSSVERATGGWVVIDDYTGSWLRDHNGSHLFSLDLGLHHSVRKSMDRYYGLDCTSHALYSYYASDFEPAHPLPIEPIWTNVEGFITGDVPNFRTLGYWWYFRHTGDLELVRQRFEYIKGAFMRQNLHHSGYLAEYCFDETYGIGPIGAMRTGKSCDNSFIALSAARKLAFFADLLGRNDSSSLAAYADNIHKAIESTFWLEKEGYYAMRQTPEGKIDKTPLSIGLMRPIWAGGSDEVSDHAIRSALYVYENLYQKNGFLKLIPTHDQTVTMAIGYLLHAMKRIGHPGIDRVIVDLLKWADPSGTFGEYLDDAKDGPVQCYEHMAHRNRMWESGINCDSLIEALTGFEPNAFAKRATFTPHLPKGWKNFAMENFRVGTTGLSLKLERKGSGVRSVLTADSEIMVDFYANSFDKKKPQLKVDGRKVEANWQKNRFGWQSTLVEFTLERGHSITIEA